MRALRLLVCVLAVCYVTAPAALAQGGATNPFVPFSPSTPATSSTTQTVPSTTTSSGGGDISGTGAIGIAVGAIVVLGGISLFIWRDARRRAPVRRRTAAATPVGPSARQAPKQRSRKLSPAEKRRRKRGRAR